MVSEPLRINQENRFSERSVVALPLELALEGLASSGREIKIKKTYSTKPSKGNGCWRVVRQTFVEDKILLVIAEECEGVAP